jgi:nucleoid-associated protein YgaU
LSDSTALAAIIAAERTMEPEGLREISDRHRLSEAARWDRLAPADRARVGEGRAGRGRTDLPVGRLLRPFLLLHARAATAVTVTAQRGDTLESIALRMIGDADYTLDIREANEGVALPRRDTDPLTAGTKLKIPSDKL